MSSRTNVSVSDFPDTRMAHDQRCAISVRALSHRFGPRLVLDGLDLEVPEGAFYALLGANGAGKTTLLQLLTGARRVQRGSVSLFGVPLAQLPWQQRQQVTYVAEGQELPEWMRLAQLEAFCAPLHPGWDASLAVALRRRFDLDPSQRLGAMSRGQRMKAALLCALAPRPRLIVMDEPFTGMDVAVKDELVRGLLDAASLEGATVLLSTHDIAEVEPLADWVGFLDGGRIILAAPLDELRSQYKRVELVTDATMTLPERLPAHWLSVERAGLRLSVLLKDSAERPELPAPFREATRVDVHEVSLKELYIALATASRRRAEAMAS